MSPVPFPCCRWPNQPGSLHLDVKLFNHTCCPHSTSIPAAPADFIRHNLVFLKALLGDAICLSSVLQLVAWIWTTNPCDTGDQALKREERILPISVHGNVSGGNSIPDVRHRKEWCAYTGYRDVSFIWASARIHFKMRTKAGGGNR